MIGGSGIGLQFPTVGYQPTVIGQGIGVPTGSNLIDVPAGGIFVIPPGRYLVAPGRYSWVQILDPVMGIWIIDPSVDPSAARTVESDGVSFRIFNPLGTPVGALMTASGTTYTQAATAVTVSAGGSTWRPIVGGAISQTVTITGGGTNYTYRPTISIDAPPVGGVPATAICTISAGAVNAVTVVNQGAGYKTAPTIRVYPHPLDPNYAKITTAVLTAALAGTGDATGVAALLNTTPGTVVASPPTLTITGGDSNATATAIMALTITATALSNSGGAGYAGTAVAVSAVGGLVSTAASSIVNPRISNGLFVPRAGTIYAPISGGAAGTAIIADGGIYQVAPVGIVLATSSASAGLPSTASAATFTMGSTSDTVLVQPIQ